MYLLANCPLHIRDLAANGSKWPLFQVSGLEAERGQTVFVRSVASNTFALSTPERSPVFITASENCIAHLLDEKIYELCAETLFRRHVLHLHSAFVLHKNKAILFTGPSGIGKTTQAELWRDHQGAEIVNGDVSLIRKWEGCYRAFGAPVHGASPYCENKSAPIAAVIVLRQGNGNRLETLDRYTALSHCLPELYRPSMPEETRDILWETADDFFSRIPVCRLTCRPDREATELVKWELGL